MVDNDSLVKQVWVKWKRYDRERALSSGNELKRWLAEKDKRVLELTDTAIKWKILRYPKIKKDNGEKKMIKKTFPLLENFNLIGNPV